MPPGARTTRSSRRPEKRAAGYAAGPHVLLLLHLVTAASIRPKPRKRHRLRNLVIAAAVVGGVVALVQSPLRNKISERLFGPAPEEEPESIELPGAESSIDYSQPAEQFGEPAQANPQAEGNGVASAPSGIETGQG